jgi:predicted ribosome quality control (RQC) complex YloA/Tae2 family protein
VASKGRPYRTFLVEGFEVLVGKSARDNDNLTFRVARPQDVWLHVAGGTPGSHVVIRSPDEALVPPEVIQRAAELAAWYSDARHAARVDVHVCHARDVSKPRGAPAGLVELRRYRRVRVSPAKPDEE